MTLESSFKIKRSLLGSVCVSKEGTYVAPFPSQGKAKITQGWVSSHPQEGSKPSPLLYTVGACRFLSPLSPPFPPFALPLYVHCYALLCTYKHIQIFLFHGLLRERARTSRDLITMQRIYLKKGGIMFHFL